ncbi:hypothetical protein THAOC_26266 [Thalassiosira oceanica]|uniref:Uncharacterized protein n=1 Tax=Thalassiosira oceanica TaxID=159749 RepID=K0S5M1_THAOC|nr:hypothetical protein THAOC_26266 [Thalassiosira oceanica]|eukprot:EJK54167.1 hypothetical protein THAOC_26266 [Thalassiosira oceanica]
MSSQPDDCDAFEATTSIEEITGDGLNQDTLRSLKNDELSDLWLCQEWEDHGDYVLEGSPGELEWLGHFAMKSTRLESFGILGGDVFHNCSEQSIDRFLFDLRKCNHIKKMHFVRIYLAEIIYKLGGAMKSNNITRLVVEGCCLGVPEATFLFNTLPDVMEELCIDCDDDEEFLSDMLDDDIMAKCILPLAACKGMQKLTLNGLNLSSSSCAALSAVFPRMAALLELNLRGNLIDDDCARVLAQGLSDCKQIQSLSLSRNRISDDGLDVLIQGLPTSVDMLDLAGNEIALARQIPLLRFKKLVLSVNSLCPDGPRVLTASLANPECRLESLIIYRCNIGNEGAVTLAEGLRNNQKLTFMSLEGNNITEEGWNAFLSILCNPASINATYNSNHALRNLGYADIPQGLKSLLRLNRGQDKNLVAAKKILQAHRHLDMKPLFDRQLELMPYMVAWLDRFGECRLDLKLSSLYEFARAMPMVVVEGFSGMKKGKKRRRSCA